MVIKPLPVGVDDFAEIVRQGYYYVDKTMLIKQILELKGKVNLFTRPRRFGKSLSLSMLRYFFEDTGNPDWNKENQRLFNSLWIIHEKSLCADWMAKHPVINITLKSAKQPDFDMAYYQLCDVIKGEFSRHGNILKSGRLTDAEKEQYMQMRDGIAPRPAYYTALKFLSDMLYKAIGSKVIILIDEYDVPLENAYFRKFYREMSDFIRSFLESALKTNESLEFAVMTGCLRITKESIFTGLNHLEINTVLSSHYSECFGFTPQEVRQITSDYGCGDKLSLVQTWYDGYQIGNAEIYNPWSVIKYIKDLCADKNALPQTYWINTSSNEIVKNFVKRAGIEEKGQIERLMKGGSLEVAVHEEVTYEDIDSKGEALWNFLFFTGYLTKQSSRLDDQGNVKIKLAIPNLEVKKVYDRTILAWFHEELRHQDFHDMYEALENGDSQRIQAVLNAQLQRSISFYDSAENFYHGFMVGILSQSQKYYVKSNRESGSGRGDIFVYPADLERKAFVLELKASEKFQAAQADAQAAVNQIREKRYGDSLAMDGYGQIEIYGIAFFRKNCKVCYGGKYKLS